jgi:hypothetical protein
VIVEYGGVKVNASELIQRMENMTYLAKKVIQIDINSILFMFLNRLPLIHPIQKVFV